METWVEHDSEHYRFRFRACSLAATEIDRIADVQERCLEHIRHVLDVQGPPRITYVLCDSPEDVAAQSSTDGPTAAVVDYPATVYAEYSSTNRCIGPHEDAHLVAHAMGHPASTFVRESVAMFFDGTWWGIPNRAWVQHFLDASTYVAASRLIEDFDQVDCTISYPVAGFWAQLLLERFGADLFVRFYANAGSDAEGAFLDVFGISLESFDAYLARHAHDVGYAAEIVSAMTDRRSRALD